jgi:type IV pilus assembly protein PilF
MLLLLGLVLAGCASVATKGAPETKDLVTASDESDASKRARVRMELAAAYFGRGQMTTALDQVKLAIQADPTLGAAFNLRGLIYANLGEHALAEESFRQALKFDANDADALQNFGWYLCQQKRYDEADALFARALTVPRYAHGARTLLAQGVCQAFAGRLDIAEETLGKSYELEPGNPSTGVNLAEVLYRRGEYQRARFYIRRVNAMPDVSNAQTLWLAARIERKMGNAAGVQAFGRQLQERFPEARETGQYQRGTFDE